MTKTPAKYSLFSTIQQTGHLTLMVFLAISALTAPLSIQAAEQVLWYPFDDPVGSSTVKDASGNGHDGTVMRGVTLDGNTAVFDGINGYIEMPDNLMAGLSNISVTAEVFIEETQASPYFIYGLGNISDDRGNGYLFTTGNGYRTSISDCHWSCEENAAMAGNLPRGSWLKIAYTLENGIAILYLNGKEVGRNEGITLTPGEIGLGYTINNFLGKSLYKADHLFKGALADFQIWSGALTPAEVKALAPQQVLWYPFDDSADATIIADASGNGNDGKVAGGVTLNGDYASLDGSSGYIDLPDNMMAGLDAITIMTKVFIENDQASPYFIYGLGNISDNRGNGYLFTTGNYYRSSISTCHWSCEQNTGTSGSNLGRGDWHHLAYTLADGIGILYLDGVETSRNSNISIAPKDIGYGKTSANFLGRSLYSADHYFHGKLDDFQIFDGALSANVIAKSAKDALAEVQLTDAESVSEDTKALELKNADDVRGHLFLASSGANGSAITWKSSDTKVIATDGIVHRTDKTNIITLTATITKGKESSVKSFQATVPPLTTQDAFAGYMFAYFRGEGTADGEQVYFALSNGNNALSWQTLNNESPVLTSTLGENGVRDPFIIRSPEGDKFYMIATDLKINGNWDWAKSQTWGSQSLLVWESTDLVNWSEPWLSKVSPETAGNTWAPEAFWDEEKKSYIVFWASNIYNDATHSNATYNKIMYSYTRDFVNFSEAQVWVDAGYSTIDSTLVKNNSLYYRFTKDERSASESACGKFILSETSSSLSSLSWNFLTKCIGKGKISHGEGPLIFKSNIEEKWHMFIDEFGKRGYIPFETTNLDSGKWTASTNYKLPSKLRHGTVVPVTAKEYQAIKDKWGN